MSRVLAATVILTDENGQPKIFNAGDEPTKKWADQIDNPKAWAKKGDAASSDEAPADDEEVVPDDADPEDSEGGDVDEEDSPPAKNAKVEVWKEYAESKGIELGDDATRKDYQDAVDAL